LRRVLEDEESGDQAELDRLAAALNEHLAGKTLAQVRDALAREVGALRTRAHTVLERALWLGWRALEAQDESEPGDLVIATRLALLDQPEFQDPSRVKQLFGAIEAKESLLRILHKMIDAQHVTWRSARNSTSPSSASSRWSRRPMARRALRSACSA
jgi:transcriptional regulator of heat shock response